MRSLFVLIAAVSSSSAFACAMPPVQEMDLFAALEEIDDVLEEAPAVPAPVEVAPVPLADTVAPTEPEAVAEVEPAPEPTVAPDAVVEPAQS